MRVFYIMLGVAAVAVLVALVAVISSGWEGEGRAVRDTTTAVEGSRRDCGALTGSEKERCLEDRDRGALSPGAALREMKPGSADTTG